LIVYPAVKIDVGLDYRAKFAVHEKQDVTTVTGGYHSGYPVILNLGFNSSRAPRTGKKAYLRQKMVSNDCLKSKEFSLLLIYRVFDIESESQTGVGLIKSQISRNTPFTQ
jgi:hypothetical protein